MGQNPGYVVGIDIGGTFTDIVLLDRSRRQYYVHKLLTSTSDPSQSVLQGIQEILNSAGVEISQLDYVVHGTTLTANTIIQRQGATTALLVTEGFEDILEMRNEQRYDVYDLFSTFPKPLVPAERRIPVLERVTSDGQVLIPLDHTLFREQVRRLDARKIEAIAICFLHSYANPIHEQVARRIVSEEMPGVAISVSSDIVPRAGEYGRMSTAAANAYVQPIMRQYLERLESQLQVMGCRGDLYLMLSDGGMTSVETAKRFPVRLFESGPAAGVTATANLSRQTLDHHLIAFDMGGTTAKICLVDDGMPLTTWDLEVDRAHRFSKGSGLPLRIPSIDMIEIGAGGGSLAHVNELGLLKVGPTSAGSTPGPCCYGRGGEHPTVTDALVTLGYLNPEYFLGGRLPLDLSKAKEAIDRDVATQMGMSVDEAALGIYRIACGQMAEAMRVHVAERGKDPRRYALVAFGGAGPVHACELARMLKIPRVIVPPAAGIISACGLLMAPLAFSVVQSYPHPFSEIDLHLVRDKLSQLSEQARGVLDAAGVAENETDVTWSLDIKYVGQKHTIEVPLADHQVTAEHEDVIREAFERLYVLRHGRSNRALDLFVEALKVRVSGPLESPDWISHQATGSTQQSEVKHRSVRFPGHQAAIRCPVIHRSNLVPGDVHPGPAIIEEPETTTVVGPQDQYALDSWGNIVVHLFATEHNASVREENRRAFEYAH